MNEHRSIKTYLDLTTLSLNDQTKFRLNDVDKIKNCFDFEREAVFKKLSKLVASLEYMDKILILLSATSGGVNIHINYWSNKEIIERNKKEEDKT